MGATSEAVSSERNGHYLNTLLIASDVTHVGTMPLLTMVWEGMALRETKGRPIVDKEKTG